MELLEYAAIKDNVVVNLQTFANDVTESFLEEMANQNSIDKYILRTQRLEIGSYLDGDIWILPKPYDSWVLNDDSDWVPPISMPSDGFPYSWDEKTTSWIRFDVI